MNPLFMLQIPELAFDALAGSTLVPLVCPNCGVQGFFSVVKVQFVPSRGLGYPEYWDVEAPCEFCGDTVEALIPRPDAIQPPKCLFWEEGMKFSFLQREDWSMALNMLSLDLQTRSYLDLFQDLLEIGLDYVVSEDTSWLDAHRLTVKGLFDALEELVSTFEALIPPLTFHWSPDLFTLKAFEGQAEVFRVSVFCEEIPSGYVIKRDLQGQPPQALVAVATYTEV